jgi:hypothetical protein
MRDLESISIDLPAIPTYFNILGASIGALLEQVPGLAEPEQFIPNAQLAAQELAGNVVEHANPYAGSRLRVVLLVDTLAHTLLVELRETGPALNPALVGNARAGLEPILLPSLADPLAAWTRELDNGVLHKHALRGAVVYQRVDGENRWCMTACLKPEPV